MSDNERSDLKQYLSVRFDRLECLVADHSDRIARRDALCEERHTNAPKNNLSSWQIAGIAAAIAISALTLAFTIYKDRSIDMEHDSPKKAGLYRDRR